ncbi:MAG: hypothetical protein KDD44_09350 [Bdellovibrionales bacterium]|nr:hypothetical protein [Bdellovibrionales bacterium]
MDHIKRTATGVAEGPIKVIRASDGRIIKKVYIVNEQSVDTFAASPGLEVLQPDEAEELSDDIFDELLLSTYENRRCYILDPAWVKRVTH